MVFRILAMSKTTPAYLDLSEIYGSFDSTFLDLSAEDRAFAQGAVETVRALAFSLWERTISDFLRCCMPDIARNFWVGLPWPVR